MATVASLKRNCGTKKSILVAGAGGFIDANFVLEWLTRGPSTSSPSTSSLMRAI